MLREINYKSPMILFKVKVKLKSKGNSKRNQFGITEKECLGNACVGY